MAWNDTKIDNTSSLPASEWNAMVTDQESRVKTTLTGQTVGGSDGDLVYLSGDNTWSQADASAESTASGMFGIRVSATSVQIKGIYTTTGLTAASIYYASETAGAITTTKPTTSTSIVRVIGYALSATQLIIDPDKTWIEVA